MAKVASSVIQTFGLNNKLHVYFIILKGREEVDVEPGGLLGDWNFTRALSSWLRGHGR